MMSAGTVIVWDQALAWFLGPRSAFLVPRSGCPDPFATGRLVKTLRLSALGAQPTPLETLLGSGLDARQFTDLSTLTPETLVTPNNRFYIRTAFPDVLDAGRPWTIKVHGLVRAPRDVRLDELAPLAVPVGPYLMECAGNNNPDNYGLMSVARWTGVPIGRVIEQAGPVTRGSRVLVSGVDRHSTSSRSSVPGASWIFTLDALDRAGAILATHMNGEPLPRHHGFPVRLVVPRWYGCACIKWVDEIALLDENAPATSQMREFAARTHQDGQPALARDYRPATIDTAATPVRVEQWLVDGRITYRVVGVVWGGEQPARALAIRFNRDEPFVPVTLCPAPATSDIWSLWSHVWRPRTPGRYQIVLRVTDPITPASRLDMYFYLREVWIDEV